MHKFVFTLMLAFILKLCLSVYSENTRFIIYLPHTKKFTYENRNNLNFSPK